MNSVEYGELETVDKRAVILDFFFKAYNEEQKFTYIKPKDFKKTYKLTSNQHRTLNRNFNWLYSKYLIIGEIENDDSENVYNISFKLNHKEFTYNIPLDKIKRFHYAKLLSALLTSSEATADKISFFKETVAMGISFITKLSDGIARDVFLASKIYEYFKCNSGSLLNILLELSHLKQPIQVEFKNGNKIENGIINSLGIYENGDIEVLINEKNIILKSVDDIVNILILSSNYPTSNSGLPLMNTKMLIDTLKQQKNYNRMVEVFYEYLKDDLEDKNLEELIYRLSKPTKDCLNLCQRANRQIKLTI